MWGEHILPDRHGEAAPAALHVVLEGQRVQPSKAAPSDVLLASTPEVNMEMADLLRSDHATAECALENLCSHW